MNQTELEIQNLTAYPYNQNLLENETAVCSFFVAGKAVYKTETGKYYFHYLEPEDMEFFYFGQVEAIKELEPVPEDDQAQLASCEEWEAVLPRMGFHLIRIVYESEQQTRFTLYSETLQVYCDILGKEISYIFLQTHDQLAALAPRVNTFAAPLTLTLDEDGNVVQGVQK